MVTLLLRHLVGVPWYKSALYGDSFTPLMVCSMRQVLEVHLYV